MLNIINRLRNRTNYAIQILFTMLANKYLKNFFLKQYQVWGDKTRLKIAQTAIVNNALFNLSSGNIVIEDGVFFGHNVSVITGTHDYTKFNSERIKAIPEFGRDIIIKKGVFVGSNVTILGPCIIGEHSVIGACCLIHENIEPYTICYSNNSFTIKKINNN